MKRACAAIARSTKEPCKKNALPGSCYCISHVEKTPLLCGAIIGTLLGYLVSWILPSPELTELRKLRDDVKPVISLVETSFPSIERSEALEQLKDDYERLRKDVEAQKDTLSPRKLTPGQTAIIAEQISPIKEVKVHFLLIASDPEADSLKEQIKKALEAGGWSIEKEIIAVVGAFTGITLFASQDPPNEAISILYHTLKGFGLTPQLVRNKDLPEDVVQIKIGKKN